MPSGIYKHKLCSEETKRKISEANKIALLGNIPWNKGLKGYLAGEKHYNFNKGTSTNYSALHKWVSRRLGKASYCIWCFTTKYIEWANKSHEYKRDLTDWLQLCIKCHKKYDGNSNERRVAQFA